MTRMKERAGRRIMCGKDMTSLGDDASLSLARKNVYSPQHKIFQKGRGRRSLLQYEYDMHSELTTYVVFADNRYLVLRNQK